MAGSEGTWPGGVGRKDVEGEAACCGKGPGETAAGGTEAGGVGRKEAGGAAEEGAGSG